MGIIFEIMINIVNSINPFVILMSNSLSENECTHTQNGLEHLLLNRGQYSSNEVIRFWFQEIKFLRKY